MMTELLKLRTVRMTWGLLAAGAILTAAFSALEASRAGTSGAYSPGPLYTASGFGAVISGGIWGLLFAAVIGVVIVTSEFRHQTITLTYLDTPSRDRVLIAKLEAGAVAGAISGVLSFLIALVAGYAFTLGRGYHVVIGDGTLARYGAGHLLAGALMATLGVGIGALVKSQLVGVIIVLGWSVVIESFIGGLFPSSRPYLPYTAATSLSGMPLGSGAFGSAHTAAGTGTPLPFAATAALLLAMTALLAVLAARTTLRRDVA
jgi:ABC-2 type transport system permease protein